MEIQRWPGSAPGRSNAVAYAGLVWVVANARTGVSGIDAQTQDALAVLDATLAQAGSSRRHLLSVHVLLADLSHKEAFDAHWLAWIGPDTARWPQRACYGAALSNGLLVELVVTAASASDR